MKKQTMRIGALLIVLCMMLTMVFAACKKDDNPPIVPSEKVSISLSVAKDAAGNDIKQINYDGTLQFEVTVENAEDKSYTWSATPENVVKIENNVLSVIDGEKLTLDQYVVVTVTAKADTTKTASYGFTITAPRTSGHSGNLTSEHIKEVSNAAITVTGKLTDNHIDNVTSRYSYTREYDFTVKMADGLWYGEWGIHGSAQTVSQLRGRGDEIVHDKYGKPGNALLEYSIDKNNQLSAKALSDYRSIPILWNNLHLWNELGQLDINKFQYDAESSYTYNQKNSANVELYEYVFDHTINYENPSLTPDPYRMAYIAYGFTPLLESGDWFDSFYFIFSEDKIIGFLAKTPTISTPEDAESPDQVDYTEVEVMFSDLGTTKVDMPSVYTADEYTSVLADALKKMQDATNYSAHAVQKEEYAVSPDPGDYESDMMSASGNVGYEYASVIGNANSAQGTVGQETWVTNQTVLICETGKYSATMDGKEYHTSYSGYQKIDDNHYDYFEYKSGQYVGQQRLVGTIYDQTPDFQFAAELFKGAMTSSGYVFTLKETAITRAIAMQMDTYHASNAEESASAKLTIVVKDGNISSVTYPYNVNDSYIGTVTVTYSKVGTTDLKTLTGDNSDPMEGYVAREVPTTWASSVIKYYDDEDGKRIDNATTDVAMRRLFGNKATNAKFPTFGTFIETFGDSFYGPFWDSIKVGEDSEGKSIDLYCVSITYYTPDLDEHGVMTNEKYFEIIDAMDAALKKLDANFKVSEQFTDTTGGASTYQDKFYTWINEDLDLLIRTQNNRTGHIWIEFYNLNDYIQYRGK